jgi:hypothetical protein
MKAAFIAIPLIISALNTGCGELRELDRQIKEKEIQLYQLNSQINDSTGPELEATNDLQASFKISPISIWLQEVTSPAFTVSAVGVQHHGDLVYVGGTGKAWIEPERDTKLRLNLARLHLDGEESILRWSALVSSTVESRVKIRAGIFDSNTKCEGSLTETRLAGELTLEQVRSSTVSYSLAITSPPSIPMPAKCYLDRLGTYDIPFNVNVAKEVSKGAFDLGFTMEGNIDIAPNDRRYSYTITSKNPQLKVQKELVKYQTDLEVDLRPKR